MTWQPKTFVEEAYLPASFQEQKPQLKGGLLPQIAAGTLAFGQGGMPLFDEAGAYLGEKLGVGGDIPYEKRLENIRGVESAFKEEHPVLDPALRFSGAVAATAPFAGAIKAAPVATSALYGGAQGFTGAEGGVGNRSIGGAVGAGIGAGGGWLAERYLKPLVSSAGGGGSPIKSKEAQEIIEKLDVSPEDFASRLRGSTIDDFAGELGGERLRMLTQSKAKLDSPVLNEAREAMRERLRTAPQRTQGIIEETFRPQQNVKNLLSNLDDIEKTLPELYNQAYSKMVPRSVALDQINTPAGQSALKATIEKLQNKGIALSDTGIVEQNGFIGLSPKVPLSTMHEFTESLGDLVKRNPITGAIEGSDSVVIEGLRKNITDAMAEASPEFFKANAAAAAKLQGESAFSMGRKLAKSAAGEKADEILERTQEVFSPNELTYRNAGIQQGLQDITKDVPLETGNPASRLANQKVVELIGETIGQPESQNFAQKIMAEKLRMELANRALFGSNTPETLGQAIYATDITSPKTAMINKLLGKASEKMNAASEERLMQALFARSPEEKAYLAASLLRGGKPEASTNPFIQAIATETPMLPAKTYGSLYYGGNQ